MSRNASEVALASQGVIPKLRRSGVVQVNEKLCLACRECEVACSLFHEGQCNPELSRIRMIANDFVPGLPDIRVCKQCDWPACYYACAAKWEQSAIVIDESSGARAIDESVCRGCAACARACPLTPERSVISSKKVERKRIHLKCDLCRGRDEGPLCVQICPGKALTYVPAQERRGESHG